MGKLLNFVKYHGFDVIVSASVIAFLIDLFTGSHTFSITAIAFYIIAYAGDSEKSKTNISERKRLLRSKGLTPEDLNNIKFVKEWEETRKKGPVKYSIVYGGIFFGFAMCGIISVICALIEKDLLKYLSADPSNMVGFIGYTYIAGIISGTIIYRLLWRYKEQKFLRLTDPLH